MMSNRFRHFALLVACLLVPPMGLVICVLGSGPEDGSPDASGFGVRRVPPDAAPGHANRA